MADAKKDFKGKEDKPGTTTPRQGSETGRTETGQPLQEHEVERPGQTDIQKVVDPKGPIISRNPDEGEPVPPAPDDPDRPRNLPGNRVGDTAPAATAEPIASPSPGQAPRHPDNPKNPVQGGPGTYAPPAKGHEGTEAERQKARRDAGLKDDGIDADDSSGGDFT